jgi:hypothetical protein
MNGTTPVPGPTIIIGVLFSGGNLNSESLIKILFIITFVSKSLFCSKISLRYLDVSPYLDLPLGRMSVVKEIAI